MIIHILDCIYPLQPATYPGLFAPHDVMIDQDYTQHPIPAAWICLLIPRLLQSLLYDNTLLQMPRSVSYLPFSIRPARPLYISEAILPSHRYHRIGNGYPILRRVLAHMTGPWPPNTKKRITLKANGIYAYRPPSEAEG